MLTSQKGDLTLSPNTQWTTLEVNTESLNAEAKLVSRHKGDPSFQSTVRIYAVSTANSLFSIVGSYVKPTLSLLQVRENSYPKMIAQLLTPLCFLPVLQRYIPETGTPTGDLVSFHSWLVRRGTMTAFLMETIMGPGVPLP